MNQRASGTFEVKLTPQPAEEATGGELLGRMVIAKAYYGDLEASGQGQMLTAMTPVKTSAGYVAIERVSGRLGGRAGSFILQHCGVMTSGSRELSAPWRRTPEAAN